MFITNFKAIFFDFDGVIKDSVEVKSDAFYELFIPFSRKLALKIRKHHEENGGMSRYEKLPLYLEWAGQAADKEKIEEYAAKFSQKVTQRVIDSSWVCGVLDYLQSNHGQQLYLISATPQKEIEIILEALKIDNQFKKIVGSPTTKDVAISKIMDQYQLESSDCVMIGDAISDYKAAMNNNISFVLRKTPLNMHLQTRLECELIQDFCHG